MHACRSRRRSPSLAALQQLQARGAASASEVAAADERLLTAQSSLASLKQRTTQRYAATDVQRASAQAADSRASLAAAQHDLSNSLIRAPFAGTVFSLPVQRTTTLPAAKTLCRSPT